MSAVSAAARRRIGNALPAKPLPFISIRSIGKIASMAQKCRHSAKNADRRKKNAPASLLNKFQRIIGTMNNSAKIILCCSAMFFAGAFAASAHQPRLVPPGQESIEVKNPEVSQAFYGQFKENPHIYNISSGKEFEIYLNVLVPDLPGAQKDVSAALLKAGDTEHPVAVLDGINFNWQPYHEEFANDDYFKGPEFGQTVPAGDYEVRVWSSNNDSKYVLVIGKKEQFFTPSSIIDTITTLPAIKSQFFGKPAYTAFTNKIGLYLLGLFVVLLLIIRLIWWLVFSN